MGPAPAPALLATTPLSQDAHRKNRHPHSIVRFQAMELVDPPFTDCCTGILRPRRRNPVNTTRASPTTSNRPVLSHGSLRPEKGIYANGVVTSTRAFPDHPPPGRAARSERRSTTSIHCTARLFFPTEDAASFGPDNPRSSTKHKQDRPITHPFTALLAALIRRTTWRGDAGAIAPPRERLAIRPMRRMWRAMKRELPIARSDDPMASTAPEPPMIEPSVDEGVRQMKSDARAHAQGRTERFSRLTRAKKNGRLSETPSTSLLRTSRALCCRGSAQDLAKTRCKMKKLALRFLFTVGELSMRSPSSLLSGEGDQSYRGHPSGKSL